MKRAVLRLRTLSYSPPNHLLIFQTEDYTRTRWTTVRLTGVKVHPCPRCIGLSDTRTMVRVTVTVRVTVGVNIRLSLV